MKLTNQSLAGETELKLFSKNREERIEYIVLNQDEGDCNWCANVISGRRGLWGRWEATESSRQTSNHLKGSRRSRMELDSKEHLLSQTFRLGMGRRRTRVNFVIGWSVH